MKYMGSKRAMLKNGLGKLLKREVPGAKRFVDLFTGSAAVAAHVATSFDVPVIAYDLQQYSVVLARAVIARQRKFDAEIEWSMWLQRARRKMPPSRPPSANSLTIKKVQKTRIWCECRDGWPITQAYGGHYFSARQALWLDALRMSLPSKKNVRNVALAALVEAASQCAAAPGHTAQPFQPTRTGKPFLQEAWNRNILKQTEKNFLAIVQKVSKKRGVATRADANKVAKQLKSGDLVFVDPPYSGVHYSRFYHVLETIARGRCGEVSGVGRYPATRFRPTSQYSRKSESATAMKELLKTIARRNANAILTFPDHDCSNGLAGSDVRRLAREFFFVSSNSIESRFSTLGGTGLSEHNEGSRAARHSASELVLVLKPKSQKAIRHSGR